MSFYLCTVAYSDKGDWVAEVILQGDESNSHYRERLTEQLMKGRTDFASEMLKRQNSFPRTATLSVGTQTLENSSNTRENESIDASNQINGPVDTATQSVESCDRVCDITDQINMPTDQHKVSNSEIIRQIRFSFQNDIQKKLEEATIG